MVSIRVVNVGLIRDATVDLADLSVIMGLNNTGKSTVATVVYATIKAAAGIPEKTVFGSVLASRGTLNPLRSTSAGVYSELMALVRENERDEQAYFNVIAESSESILQYYGLLLVSELQRGLGTTENEIPTRSRTGRRLPSKIIVTTPLWSITVRLSAKGPNVDVSLTKPLAIGDDDLPFFSMSMNPEEAQHEIRFLTDYGVREVARKLFRGFPESAHYLPAARSGLLQSHRLVAAAMIQRSSMVGLQEFSMPSLSGVVADFVSEVLVVGQRHGRLNRVAAEIERKVLKGEVSQVDTGTGYPELEFRDSHGSHPIHRTSSLVSELAPVVLLLRTAVSPGDVFILEEPESHLHPSAQVELAKAIYEVSRRGVLVMLTTHSDFFLATLDNIMRENILHRRKRRPAVNAYWLNATDDGSYLSNLNIHPVDGIEVDSFTEVASQLYDIRVDQQDALEARGYGDQ